MRTILHYHWVDNKTSEESLRVEIYDKYFYVKEDIRHGRNVFVVYEEEYLW